MKKPKDEIIIDGSNPSILNIDGKKYYAVRRTFKDIDGIAHEDKVMFRPIDEEKYHEDLRTVIDSFCETVTAEELMMQLLENISPTTIKSIAKKIRDGNKPRRQNGCLGFKVGNKYIQVIE